MGALTNSSINKINTNNYINSNINIIFEVISFYIDS